MITYRAHSTPMGRPLTCSGQAPIVKLAATGVVGDNVSAPPLALWAAFDEDDVDDVDGGVMRLLPGDFVGVSAIGDWPD